MFGRFGSRVTVIQSPAQIISREDPEVAAELQRVLEEEGLTFLLSARATRVEKDEDTIVVFRGPGERSIHRERVALACRNWAPAEHR